MEANHPSTHLHDRGPDKLLADIAASTPLPLTALGTDAITTRMAAVHAARRSAVEAGELIQLANRNKKVTDRTIDVLNSIRRGYENLAEAIENDAPQETLTGLCATLTRLTEATDDTSLCRCCGRPMTPFNRKQDDGVPDDVIVGGRLGARTWRETGLECEECGVEEIDTP